MNHSNKLAAEFIGTFWLVFIGCGSAIFFHVARPGYPPTEGCVALSMRDFLTLAPHVRTGTRLKVL